MKIQIQKSARTSGNALIAVLIVALTVGIALAAVLTLAEVRSKGVARSQYWNGAMVVTEAGVEDALQFLNRDNGTPDLTDWTNGFSTDGWQGVGNVYWVSRTNLLGEGTGYTVYITNIWSSAFINNPVIRCIGSVPGPQWLTAAAGANSLSSTIKRTVVIGTALDKKFPVAMAALGTIDFKGNNVSTDSFDSRTNLFSTNGRYDPTKRKAGGDVATNNSISNAWLNIGNGDVAGNVYTGPFGNVNVNNNGTIGDLNWVTTKTGLQPGHWKNDMNVEFPDVALPPAGWAPVSTTSPSGLGGAGTVNGTSYDHVFMTSGYYQVADDKTIYVGTNVTVKLLVTVDFSPNYIRVAGDGNTAGQLWVYMAGGSATLGTDDMTESGLAKNLRFYGLPSCTSLKYNGNGDFTGLIYAPSADFQLNGGGSSDVDFIGSSVTKVVQMNGHYHFHYDESLKDLTDDTGYKPSYWIEL
jgi:hypothetical protein